MTTEVKLYETVAETDNYALVVADVPGVDTTCYAIIHRKYRVIEMSTSILANAKRFLYMLETWVTAPPEDESNPTPTLPDFLNG